VKAAVIFGAGNIGRGFIGQLFHESGYHLTFVDIDLPLLAAFNQQGQYTLRLVSNETGQEITIAPVKGVPAGDREAVVQAVVEAEIGATAVGVRALPQVAPAIAAGLHRRAEQKITRPLNFLICENLKDAAWVFREMVKAELPPVYHAYLAERIGFVETVISRMIPPLPPELRRQNPGLVIAEPYKDLPVDVAGFAGPPPAIVGLRPVTPFSFYAERKLYIHNAGHAALAYLGFLKGYRYGYEALADPEIFAVVREAMVESQQALEKKYGLAAESLTDYINDILLRFRNRALGDTILRLGRDPLRKLGPQDRLVGAALTALGQGIQPDHLVIAIAAALHFDSPDDPVAGQLQAQLQQHGVQAVLRDVCGLEPESVLAELIRERLKGTYVPVY
jgi:mannitol-1-phosphate 5-dehydrogenase